MKNLLALFILLISFSSCNHQKSHEDEVKSLWDKKISFNKNIISVNNRKLLTTNDDFSKKLKIVTYIDSSSCTACGLKILKDWDKLLQEKPEEVGFIVIINSRDTSAINQNLFNIGFKRTVCFDLQNKYIDDNNLYVRARNRTFLLDENNKIIIVGEPPTNPSVWTVYKEAFKKLL